MLYDMTTAAVAVALRPACAFVFLPQTSRCTPVDASLVDVSPWVDVLPTANELNNAMFFGEAEKKALAGV